MFLRSLRKQRTAWARLILPLFVASGLNMGVAPDLAAASQSDCHDVAMQSAIADTLRNESTAFETDCVHCPSFDVELELPNAPSLYICAAMSDCSTDFHQSAIPSSELNGKSGSACSALPFPVPADSMNRLPVTRSANIRPVPSLNIQYCRFLI